MNFSRETRKIEKLVREGTSKFFASDYDSAWLAFEMALFRDEDNVIASTLGAASLLNLERVLEAEPLARNAVRLAPSLALSHYYLALVLIAQYNYDEAESEIWEAVAIEPDNGETRLALGRFLFMLERIDDAREQLTLCVGLLPDLAEAHFLLGLCLMRSGQFSEAKVELEETLRLQPENDAALNFDVLLSISKADDLLTTPPKLAGYRHAADLLRQAVELNPENELATTWLRIAEETIERISKPTDPSPPPERWYKTASKHLLIWLGLAAFSIAFFGVIIWLDDSGKVDFWPAFWVVSLFILLFDLIAFGVMSYKRRDFSAFPPSVVRFVERVGGRSVSPLDRREN